MQTLFYFKQQEAVREGECLSLAYVPAIGSCFQTPASTILYQAVWKYARFYSIYIKSAGCKPFNL
jgi:hypothetical protein